jgi:Fe-S cluster assembly protein SufD
MATTANTPQKSSRESFASDFERVRGRLAGDGSPWLSALREDAMAAFASAGFPSVRDEDWKYTNVLPALRDHLEPVLPGEVQADPAALREMLGRVAGIDGAASLLVFVDGCFHASLSRFGSVRGLRLASLRERLHTESSRLEPWLGKYLPVAAHAFAALNTAFFDDGAVVELADGAVVDAPIHLVYLSTSRERPFVSHPRNVIVAGAGSNARIVEHYIGAPGARYLTNCASEIVLGRSATVGHVRVQDESRSGFHIARVQVDQSAGSSFVSHAFGFGAALSRTEIAVKLDGEEAECSLAGLYAIDGSRHVDHHLHVDHARPRTRSNQLYKGVLEDSSRGVFTGRVVVRAGSQKIKAMQSNPSLLLGRGAVAETRPQLEIYADDVACNHGATIGRLDEDALFYLLSRGIAPREARRILVSGFAAEVVEGVSSTTLRTALTELVAARVGELGNGAAS